MCRLQQNLYAFRSLYTVIIVIERKQAGIFHFKPLQVVGHLYKLQVQSGTTLRHATYQNNEISASVSWPLLPATSMKSK